MREMAMANLDGWAHSTSASNKPPDQRDLRVYLVQDDSLDCAHHLTKRYGRTFAVLNMANAYTVYGGVRSGSGAQEENMARRTTISYNTPNNYRMNIQPTKYTPDASALVNGDKGRVMLVNNKVSVCFRTRELYQTGNIRGYEFMDQGDWFPFYELRSAALNVKHLTDHAPSMYKVDIDQVEENMKRRIGAQFDTLQKAGVRDVVLSAFGCGAFGNDPTRIATLYAHELLQRSDKFNVVAVAIFYAGFGKNNYQEFKAAFRAILGDKNASINVSYTYDRESEVAGVSGSEGSMMCDQ